MKQHTDLRSNKLLNLCDGFMFGQENPTAPDGIDGLRTNIKGCPEGRSSFGSGFPIGASSIPVGTRLSPGKSSVLYLCRADGSRSFSTPRKVWLQLRRSGGKGCPMRGSISDRKSWQAVRIYTVCQPCHLRNKGISKPPSVVAYHRIRTTTAASRVSCPSPRPPPSLSGSR